MISEYKVDQMYDSTNSPANNVSLCFMLLSEAIYRRTNRTNLLSCILSIPTILIYISCLLLPFSQSPPTLNIHIKIYPTSPFHSEPSHRQLTSDLLRYLSRDVSTRLVVKSVPRVVHVSGLRPRTTGTTSLALLR